MTNWLNPCTSFTELRLTLKPRTFRWKVLSSGTKAWSWDKWTSSLKTKNGVAFSTRSFLITNSLNIDISSKKGLYSNVDLFSVVRVVLFNMYKLYKRFYIFHGKFEVWNYNVLSFYALPLPETYSEPNQISEMGLFAESH